MNVCILLRVADLADIADVVVIDFKSIVWSESDVAFALRCPMKSQHQGSLNILN